MRLNPDEVRAVYHCVSVVRRGLMRGCCPRWLDDLFGRFDAEHKRLMSVGGHESAEYAAYPTASCLLLSLGEDALLLVCDNGLRERGARSGGVDPRWTRAHDGVVLSMLGLVRWPSWVS